MVGFISVLLMFSYLHHNIISNHPLDTTDSRYSEGMGRKLLPYCYLFNFRLDSFNTLTMRDQYDQRRTVEGSSYEEDIVVDKRLGHGSKFSL